MGNIFNSAPKSQVSHRTACVVLIALVLAACGGGDSPTGGSGSSSPPPSSGGEPPQPPAMSASFTGTSVTMAGDTSSQNPLIDQTIHFSIANRPAGSTIWHRVVSTGQAVSS